MRLNSRIIQMIKKEVLEIKRGNLIKLLVIGPVIQVIIFGYVATTDVKNVKTFICDEDNTAISRELSGKFMNSEYFKITGFSKSPEEIDKAFRENRVVMALRIPRGLEKNAAKGKKTMVQIIVDGSDSNMSLITMNRAVMIINGFSKKLFSGKIEAMKEKIGELPSISLKERVWYNPELKSANTMVPGVIGMILMLVTLVITSVALVREKESGNIEQLVVTPIRPVEIIIGKTLPYAVIGLFDVILVTAVGAAVFCIPFAGNFFLLIALSLFVILANLGLGILISTVSSTQQQAMLSSMFIMLPNILLSGFIFPIKNMPVVLQWLTYLMPLRYYMVIIRGIFLKGLTFAELLPQSFALLLFGVLLFAAAVKKFHKVAA